MSLITAVQKKKCISYILCTAIILSMPGSLTVNAAKKLSLSPKNISIKEGKKKQIKIKNAARKAVVNWKTSKKSVVKIIRKNTKGKSAFAEIKAVKAGKAVITAVYKLAGKITKLKCRVVVKKSGTEPAAQSLPANVPQNPQVTSAVIPAPPTQTPVPTPEPTPTPVPFENLVPVNELETQQTIPDIFTYIDGTPVTADNWNGRAEEIRQMYQYYMYGMWRNGEGESLSYSTDGSTLNIDISVDGSVEGQAEGASASFSVDVNVPAGDAPAGGWPVIISMGSLSEQETALANGYAVINYDNTQVSSDSSARTGAFYTLYPYDAKEWRKQTGVLMAWAWGASKILDALYDGAGNDYKINPGYAIIGGVSRLGKATAIAGAFDTRFKISLPTCSGCGGMGVFRYNPNAHTTQTYDVSSLGYQNTFTYKQGDVETLGSIQSSGESYWFNQRFLEFRNIYQLPFDQHFLSALYAQEGRTLMLIGGFNWDTWQNTPSLWYNFKKAKEVFDMLDLSNNIIINLHDTEMGHNIVNSDVVNLFKYCNEMYNGIDVPDFEISDLQTTLFDLTETPANINNKEVYEAQIPE